MYNNNIYYYFIGVGLQVDNPRVVPPQTHTHIIIIYTSASLYTCYLPKWTHHHAVVSTPPHVRLNPHLIQYRRGCSVYIQHGLHRNSKRAK